MSEYATVAGPDTVRLERLLPARSNACGPISPSRTSAQSG